MPTPVERRLNPSQVRLFGTGRDTHLPPDLTEIQTKSYEAFLQDAVEPEKRKDHGLEGVLREIFPVESYDKTVTLDYVKFELGNLVTPQKNAANCA